MEEQARGEKQGGLILLSNTSAQRSGETRHAHGALREIWKRTAGPGSYSLARGTGEARLRKRFEGRVETVAGAFQDDHERGPAGSAGSQFAEDHSNSDASPV